MMENQAMELLLQLGIQFTFMVLFFMERQAHEKTRERLENNIAADRRELRRILLFMANVPPDDDLPVSRMSATDSSTRIPIAPAPPP